MSIFPNTTLENREKNDFLLASQWFCDVCTTEDETDLTESQWAWIKGRALDQDRFQ